MHQTCLSLRELHRDIIVRLATAVGHLRMVAVGAPFAGELIRLAETEVDAALDSARQAEQVRAELERILAPASIREEQR
jgi:hypothetical protein